jgi:phytoene synthase
MMDRAPPGVGLDPTAEARRLDPDRWLCALFLPPPVRDAAMALLVLNQELARIPALASQPMLGAIRHQWWREELERLGQGARPAYPALAPLGVALRSGAVPAGELRALIDTREEALETLAPQSLPELERYLAATAGRLQALTARLDGADEELAAAAARVGTAFGLIGVVRACHYDLAHGRSPLPRDLLPPEAATAAPSSEAQRRALASALRAIVVRADAILGRPCPRRARGRAALLPATLARLYSRRLHRVGFAPDAAAALTRPPDAPLRLWWAMRRGRI